MKTINLIKSGEGADQVDGKDILIGIMDNPQPQQGGANQESMRRRVNIANLAEKSSDTLDLEDADFEFARAQVASFTFYKSNSDLLAVIDALTTPIVTEPAK